ncbi:MAG: hypothetical protein U0527_04940 [Candidatus Eisenbacteria bacterium]
MTGHGPRELFLTLIGAGIVANLLAIVLVRRRGGRLASAESDEIWIHSARPLDQGQLPLGHDLRADRHGAARAAPGGLAEVKHPRTGTAAYRLLESFRFLPALFMAALFPALENAGRRPRELLALLRKGMRWMALHSRSRS